MEVPRSTVGIWNGGKKIPLGQVRPGDLLVFTTVRAGASHAGIVLESSPKGITFIISSMNESYYKTRFMGARNFF